MDTPVSGTPRLLLRLEGLTLLVGAVLGYAALDASWFRFAVLLLVPDRDTHLGRVGRIAPTTPA